MDTAFISDIGRLRKKNEDHYLVMDEYGLFAVCDGMGGHKGGDIASKIAVDCLQEAADNLSQNPITALNTAIYKANYQIRRQAQVNPQWHEMGTTITAAIIRENQLALAHVGDSSLYIFRNDSLKKVTRDHTLAEKMVTDGLLKNEDKKSSGYNHILTRALGIQEEVIIDNFEYQLYCGDLVLLCSDGLSDMLDDSEMETILNQQENLPKSLNTLLDTALEKGGYDNITIILLRI